MCRTCDLLEVPLGGGGDSAATETTSLFTSVKGLPLPAFIAPTPPLLSSLYFQEDLRGMGPHDLSQSSLCLFITQNPPVRATKDFFWQVFREVDCWAWKSSAVFPLCSDPVPQGDPITAVAPLGETKGNSLFVAASEYEAYLIFKPTLIS